MLTLDAGHAAVARAREAGAEIEEFDGGAELLLARTVGADGRSRAFLGGRAAPVGVLAEIGAALVVVHGQSDQIRLKSPVAQRSALDKFAGESLAGSLAGYQELHAHWKAIQAELDTLRSAARERLREAESLRLPWPRSTPSTRSRARTSPSRPKPSSWGMSRSCGTRPRRLTRPSSRTTTGRTPMRRRWWTPPSAPWNPLPTR